MRPGWFGAGCNAHFDGDNHGAIQELGQSIEMFRELGEPFGLAWALTMHGLAATLVGQREVASRHFREALPIFAEVDDVSGIDFVLEHLARLAAAEGDPRRAARLPPPQPVFEGSARARSCRWSTRVSRRAPAPSCWIGRNYR